MLVGGMGACWWVGFRLVFDWSSRRFSRFSTGGGLATGRMMVLSWWIVGLCTACLYGMGFCGSWLRIGACVLTDRMCVREADRDRAEVRRGVGEQE